MFSTQNASGGGAFGTAGQQQPGASSSNLFGSTSQPAAGGSTLFGSTTQQAPGTGGSIFGSAPAGSQTAGATGGGMFSTPNTQTGGSLFGSTPAQQPSGGGLFGSTAPQPAAGNPFSSQSTAGATAPAGTSLFGSASTNTPGSGGGSLFGNAATGGGLFGSTGGTNTTATGGGPFGSTGGVGSTNAGRGLFGSTTGVSTTGTTGGLFGNAPGGTTTGATGGGLFGGSTTTPMNTGGGLFGSTTATQPNTGGGLFGTAGNAPSNTGGGLFGSSTAGPFSSGTGGGLFGGTTNAPSTAGTGSLFGGGTAASTGSLFGGQAQAGLSAGQPSLFGSTVGQQQQPGMLFTSNLGGSTLLGVTQGNLFASRPALAPGQQQQDPQSQFIALTQRIEAIYHAWNPASPQCRFQHYFYNLVDPNHVHLYGRPSNATNDALWQKAVRENPDPSCLVPVIATGFDDLQTRVEAQSQQAAAHQERLKEIQTRIAALTQRHQLSNVSRLQRAAALQTQLTHRVLKVVQHLHLLIPSLRSSAIRPEEEALRAVLEDIDQEIRRPGGTGRMRGKLNELWALVGAVTAARERDRKAGGVEWAVVDDEGLSQIAQILSEEQAGLAHLTKVLQKDLKDLAVIQGTSIKEEDPEYLSGSTSTLRSSSIY